MQGRKGERIHDQYLLHIARGRWKVQKSGNLSHHWSESQIPPSIKTLLLKHESHYNENEYKNIQVEKIHRMLYH